MKMKNVLTVVAAAAFAVFAQGAFAQASAPASRADVKSETKAAEKAGQLTPAGQGAAPMEKSTTKSTKTRAERKAETKMARDAGTLKPAGEAAGIKSGTPSAGSDTTRADRKATTKAAAKAGGLQPAGEAGSQQAGEAPKK
jgi:FlaG/FlaF family flagellin (archaellin)